MKRRLTREDFKPPAEPGPPKFDECQVCRFQDTPRCRRCDVGELFETRIYDEPPSDSDLLTMFKDMHGDD